MARSFLEKLERVVESDMHDESGTGRSGAYHLGSSPPLGDVPRRVAVLSFAQKQGSWRSHLHRVDLRSARMENGMLKTSKKWLFEQVHPSRRRTRREVSFPRGLATREDR
jgi:hypothetical protein